MLATLSRTLPEAIRGLRALPQRRGQIVLFHNGRCGSTVLGNLLRQHEAVHWDGEVFHGPAPHPFMKRFETRWPILYLRQRRLRAASALYGFEFKPRLHGSALSIPRPVFLRRLTGLKGNHYVFLTRRNVLRRLASICVSLKRGQWNLGREDQPTLVTVRLSPERVRDYLRHSTKEFEGIRDVLAGENVLHLSYEDDILPGPRRAYERVCRFVGIEPTPAEVFNSKMNPFPLSKIIENYEEIADVLRGTPHEWMLHAD